jgi:hypothetical protein
MKVSEIDGRLWFGDVIICCVDTNIITGEPLKRKGYVEMLVTWVRQEERDGSRDPNDQKNDFDVILMDNNGEFTHIRDIRSLDDWEYSRRAFERGAWREGDEKL